jgi:metal-sulfur cluster biosynthetic enzyme
MSAATNDDVISALKQCYDPEIPVNIVDLGLIYGVRLDPVAGDQAAGDPAAGDQAKDQQDVTVDLTLTSQGCPAHVMIGEQVKSRLESLPGIRTANVNVVWTPPWTPERISPEARKQLGIE